MCRLMRVATSCKQTKHQTRLYIITSRNVSPVTQRAVPERHLGPPTYPYSRAAPAIPPPHCAVTNMSALSGVTLRVTAMATVTAGFTWAPAHTQLTYDLTTMPSCEAMLHTEFYWHLKKILNWYCRPEGYHLFCRDFEITLRHTTLGRAPLDEWSARRRDL
jgi:hypothetical protein